MQMTITEQNVSTFLQALEALNKSDIQYVIGGAFALHHYSGVWRNTNDLDVYMERKFVPQAIDVLSREGFFDRGELAARDREWIYHAMKNHVLVDIIWQPPNHLWPVDETLYARGQEGILMDVLVRFMPPDELIWAKILIMNKHRCDWPDVFHIVRARPIGMDWEHLLRRACEHWPLLLSFIILYDWAYPRETNCIPSDVRHELLERKLQLPEIINEPTREAVLDPWIYTRPSSQ